MNVYFFIRLYSIFTLFILLIIPLSCNGTRKNQQTNNAELSTEILSDIRRALTYPPFIVLDEEGGTVSRLARSGNIPVTPIPSARSIAGSGDARSAYLAYNIIGRELNTAQCLKKL